MQVHKGLGDSEASCSSNNPADETAEIVNDDMDMNADLPQNCNAQESITNVSNRVISSKKYGHGLYPVNRFSVKIGSKKLKMWIIDAKLFHQDDDFLDTQEGSNHQIRDSSGLIFCKYCDQTFASSGEYSVHLQKHAKGGLYLCSICSKSFMKRISYRMHMKAHEEDLICKVCTKQFKDRSLLNEHQENCVSENPDTVSKEKLLRYACNYCEKKFYFRRDLVIHERIHTRERPFSCGYCNQSFAQSQALTVHIRTHTGDRPYRCHTCLFSFKDISALRKHEFLKHQQSSTS